jgi:hypothetical protein
VSIQYVTYQQLNKTKWDNCIATADNSLIYARSVYLDTMGRHWDALVMNGYEAVMPLTWNKKYGIYYLYQPAFAAHLGVFGKNITAGIVNDFLHAIPPKFKYWDIYLNHANYFKLKDFELYERMNYVLPLNEPYENIYKNYRDNIKRNIKKSLQLNCVIKKNFPVDDVIQIAKEHLKNVAAVSDENFERFKKLYALLNKKHNAVTYGVYSSSNELISSAVFFMDEKRAYYILVGNHPNGKTIGASHALIDAFIKDHAGQNLLLDFEGSDIRNLAFFYSSFGAAEEKYVGIKMNRLPRLLQLIKK